jgi:hypothetical protein
MRVVCNDVAWAWLFASSPTPAHKRRRRVVGIVRNAWRWLSSPRVEIDLSLDDDRALSLAERLGEIAGRAWREGRL